jgi:flagella basal body P-ring formation protein FlgA
LADTPPLVRNGEDVVVKVKNGNTLLTAPAVALQEGQAGSEIRVKNLTTHKILQGTLGEDKIVYIGRW